MTDESNNPTPVPPVPSISSVPPEGTAADTGESTVAFCQQCGRGLTSGAVRAVDSGIFCEACALRNRSPFQGNTPGATTGGYAPVRSPAADLLPAPPPSAGEPNPVLAGFLGLIPGVGAMYNGQYAKGVIHLVIFVVLTSLADNLNWVLWWFVWGWIFYQAFEAYHTALAKRDGMPLPDPFGWNDLGDRLGFSRTSPPVSSPPSSTRRASGAGSATHSAPAAAGPVPYPKAPAPPFATETSPFTQASETAQATGFNPLLTPASWTVPPPETLHPPTPETATATDAAGRSYGAQAGSQYQPTYTGAPAPPTMPTAATGSLAQRFPAAAIWLIVLGVLFLIANLAPGWRVEGRWLVPVLLTLVAFWIGGRRVRAAIRHRKAGAAPDFAGLAEGLVGAAVLLTVAILLALQNASLVPLRHSWPAVLVVWGALLLVGRARPTAVPISGESATGSEQAPGSAPLR